MKGRYLAVALVLIMLAVPMCLPAADSSADVEKTEPIVPPDQIPPADLKTTICGYVGDVSNLEKNIPLEDVTVKLLDSTRQVLGTYVTDGKGYFEFTYSSDNVGSYLTFDAEGYTIRTQPSELLKVEGEVNTLHFKHTSIITNISPDNNGKYQITTDVDGGSFVGMGITTSYVTGYVYSEDNKPIDGAKVTLKSAEGHQISGFTNGDGFFQIECLFGGYSLTVSCNGFEESEPIHANAGDNNIEVHLTERTHEILFGMDTPHMWEFLGIIFMSLAVGIFLIINHRINTGKSEISMVNDMEIEEVEDEEIKHP